MTEEIEKIEATKTENETTAGATDQKRIDHIAEEAAKKASHTEQKFDRDHQIFSK
jgi:hypothetical protein